MIATTAHGRGRGARLAVRKGRGVQPVRAALRKPRIGAGRRWLNFATSRIQGGERLSVASIASISAALPAYRKRLAIECRFGDTKSRGLNLEDTRLVTPRKLELLLGHVAGEGG